MLLKVAPGRTRTSDLLVRSQVLYPLSHRCIVIMLHGAQIQRNSNLQSRLALKSGVLIRHFKR